MKKMTMTLLLALASLSASPQAVVFDYGNVLAFHDSEIVPQFLCETFNFDQDEYKKAKLEKKVSGQSDEQFWLTLASQNGITLPINWQVAYKEIVRKSLGANDEMYRLVEELKNQKIKVGLFSNIEKRWANVAKSYGLFQPFNPCLLTCDIGVDKPDLRAYQILLETINLNAKDIIFIDDSIENVGAAKRAGLDAIVFESPSQIRKELQKRELL